MKSGKTVLCQKDIEKGNAVDNYRLISCLPVMWKLMIGVIADNILHIRIWKVINYLRNRRAVEENAEGRRISN